jgi:hypothetical protein
MTNTQIKMETNKAVVAEVENFIKNFDGARDSFLNGNCYYFALILDERFWTFYSTNIAYNQIDNHFATVVFVEYADGTNTPLLFDASGCIGPMTERWKIWQEYCLEEPYDGARVYRDCIWKMSEKEWMKLKPVFRERPWMPTM